MALKVINFVAFQLGWLACVLGAGAGRPWLGPIVAILVVGLHLALHRAHWYRELLLIACAAVLGYVLDSALVVGGVLVFPDRAVLGGPSALWMVALWCQFATTLNVSMSWLRGRYVLGALLGAVAGPIAYLAGARLGAVEVGRPMLIALPAIAAVWAAAMPVLQRIALGSDHVLPEAGTATEVSA